MSYLVTYWGTLVAKPAHTCTGVVRATCLLKTLRVLLAIGFYRPLGQVSWPQLYKTSGLGSAEPLGKKYLWGYSKKKNTPNPSSNLREYRGIPNLIKEKGKKKLFVEGKLRIFEDRSYKKPKLQYSKLNTVPHLGMLWFSIWKKKKKKKAWIAWILLMKGTSM